MYYFLALVKLSFYKTAFRFIWFIQKLIRISINGCEYPYQCDNFKDIFIGKYAYKYFSKFKLRHLEIKFSSPNLDIILVNPIIDKNWISKKNFSEIKELLKY